MEKSIEKTMCEDATGCTQKGCIVYYDDKGNKLSKNRAIELLNDGETIEVPSAGVGNYREIFTDLGFEEVKVIDWTSSAGDWGFGVKNNHGWFVASQENRYPYHGFRYSINYMTICCETFEKLCKMVENY